jgi:hypothetical protein
LEPEVITRAVRPFEVHPDDCMAVGGGIRVANGSKIVGGRVVEPGVSWRGVGATQVLEYLRGFFATRIAWSELNGLLIVSGTFGVFRRDLLVGFRRYHAIDLARLTARGFAGAVWFRPPLAWWRLQATVLAHRPPARLGHDPTWRGDPRAAGRGRGSLDPIAGTAARFGV